MSKLVKLNSVSEDTWSFIELAPASADDIKPYSLIPLDSWLTLSDALPDNVAPWVGSDIDVSEFAEALQQAPLIALNFAAFADGRSFSQARQLRDRFDYQGEIRAIGAFIQDQMFYLHRCGVDTFSVADDADLESIQNSLKDFSESYQAACDVQEPLFRRRA